MNPHLDPLESAWAMLKPLGQKIVFIGGTSASLHIDDPAARPRHAEDVDFVAEASSYAQSAAVERELRALGYAQSFEPGELKECAIGLFGSRTYKGQSEEEGLHKLGVVCSPWSARSWSDNWRFLRVVTQPWFETDGYDRFRNSWGGSLSARDEGGPQLLSVPTVPAFPEYLELDVDSGIPKKFVLRQDIGLVEMSTYAGNPQVGTATCSGPNQIITKLQVHRVANTHEFVKFIPYCRARPT